MEILTEAASLRDIRMENIEITRGRNVLYSSFKANLRYTAQEPKSDIHREL